jgi:hypothetical protein
MQLRCSNLCCFFNRYQTFEEWVKPDWKDRKNIAFDLAKAVQCPSSIVLSHLSGGFPMPLRANLNQHAITLANQKI